MGTPFKTLITTTPKVFSPVSPILFNLQRSNLNVNCSRPTNVARNLFKTHSENFAVKAEQTHHEIQFNIVDYDNLNGNRNVKEDLLLNTPNKLDLLSNGIDGKRLLNILGKGSFGTVVRGVHKGTMVAIKIINNVSNSCLHEENALHLNHENIVKTIDVVTSTTLNYSLVLMEYYKDCKQLQNIIHSKEMLGQKTTINFSLDICRGLDYCHQNGVLHLDVKPKNVLVYENCCKLCDFGNSVVTKNMGDYQHKGTILYTDPKILVGKVPSEKSDVYSLGILLWEIRHRKRPYENIDNNETVIYKVVKCNLRPHHEDSDAYAQLFTHCWNPDPELRPNMDQILKTLKIIYSTL